jgi:hypothetical protein
MLAMVFALYVLGYSKYNTAKLMETDRKPASRLNAYGASLRKFAAARLAAYLKITLYVRGL